jgi:cytoskeletal protein CcmA (bactofilin family)
MEEFIIAGKPVSILSKEEIDLEIDQALAERRKINFEGKNLKFLSLAEKDIGTGLNLNNAWVAGNVFLGDATINGDISMVNTVIDGSLFFGRGKVMGSLDMEKITVGQTMNLVGLNITGSLHLNQARVEGFISLAKAVILGDVDMRGVILGDYRKDSFAVKGDVFLESAQINGFFDISDATLSGQANLENALVRRSLIARNLKVNDMLYLKNCIFNLETANFSGTDPGKIVR